MGRNFDFISHDEILRYKEIERIVKAGVSCGIRKVRITGGEPLVRKNVVALIADLAEIKGIEELSLTTNGLLLAEHARGLCESGLQRVNVSLDTLHESRFRKICGAGSLDKVIEGIREANVVGLKPVKVNVVVMKDMNDDEIEQFVDFSEKEDVIVRFIEHMPLKNNSENNRYFVSHDETIEKIRHRIESEIYSAEEQNSPARYFKLKGTGRSIGFISPVTHGFCDRCNRLRLTSDGKLLSCLMAPDGINLKELVRGGADDSEIKSAFVQAVKSKGKQGVFAESSTPMHSVGG